MTTPQTLERKVRKLGVKTEITLLFKVRPGHENQIRAVFDGKRSDEFFATSEGQVYLAEAKGGARGDRLYPRCPQVVFDDDCLLVATSYDIPFDPISRTSRSRVSSRRIFTSG